MTFSAENLIPVKNLRPPQTRYRKGVKPASPSMLKRGKQNKKLGDKVSVKMWKGMTMYSLTLEERATCQSDCEQWDNCYGDNMPFAHRFDHTDPNFIRLLGEQLQELSSKHSEGFVVRLHVLGDFYNEAYLVRWQFWLHQFKNLHLFGYTHHAYTSQLGTMISNINNIYPDRFRIRFSDDEDVSFNATVIQAKDKNNWTGQGVLCPEQAGKTASCTTCGYCWASNDPVIFIEH